MSDLVLRENSGGAATLTLNRPEKFNALSKDMFEALEVHVDALARETKTIGLVILRGANGNFSAGYDMQEVLAHVKAHAKPHFHSEVIQKIANLPQPVISGRAGPLLDRIAGTGFGGRPHRRLRIGAILGRVCEMGPDAGVGLEHAPAAPYRHGQGCGNDVHLPHLFRRRSRAYAPGQLLFPGRSIRCGTWPHCPPTS